MLHGLVHTNAAPLLGLFTNNKKEHTFHLRS
nr:MAG TPA: hypothetical protein [Caudoviricetes sp.]